MWRGVASWAPQLSLATNRYWRCMGSVAVARGVASRAHPSQDPCRDWVEAFVEHRGAVASRRSRTNPRLVAPLALTRLRRRFNFVAGAHVSMKHRGAVDDQAPSRWSRAPCVWSDELLVMDIGTWKPWCRCRCSGVVVLPGLVAEGYYRCKGGSASPTEFARDIRLDGGPTSST